MNPVYIALVAVLVLVVIAFVRLTPRGAAPVNPNEPPTEQERLHAMRFARILATEIKLSNEAAVEEGRMEGDLYVRLEPRIAQAREAYLRKVRPAVAAERDYLHEAFVEELGDGDPEAMGDPDSVPRETIH